MASIRDEIVRYYREGDAMAKLILVNLGVFILFWFFLLIDFLFQSNMSAAVESWTVLPSDVSKLIFKPWTLLTYMFRHMGFGHLFWNMLSLYIFGKVFIDYLDGRRLLSTYILSGLAGAALYILFYNIFPVFSEVVAGGTNRGASGAVMGVGVAIATYAPQSEFRLPFGLRLRILWIVAFFVLKDLLVFPEGNNAGGLLAHFGGAIFGYVSIRQLQKGRDITAGFSRFMDNIANWFKPKPKVRKVYSNSTRTKSDVEYNTRKADQQQKMDEILDKISRSGYESLSKEEKDYLFKIGKE